MEILVENYIGENFQLEFPLFSSKNLFLPWNMDFSCPLATAASVK